MLGHREIGERVLELLTGIDLRKPQVDEGLVADRLCAYVEALGLPRPSVRFAPDVRALRVARVWPGQDRGHWRAFLGRQSWLLDRPTPVRQVRIDPEIDLWLEPLRLARVERTVLDVGLGRSRNVRRVRHVSQSLHWLATVLRAEDGVLPPKRFQALIPLAEAAAAGLLAHTVGIREDGDLVALVRPRMRFDDEGRLHDWDGLPAAEWPNGEGLFFWHGVEMTESAGRNPDAVTPSRIAGWANAERRRVAMERIGIEPFMSTLGGVVVQEDDYGRLWRTEREIDGEPLVAVEVVNATPEPDGSYRRYFLRVPPGTRTARKGVAWSFDLTRQEYAPAVES